MVVQEALASGEGDRFLELVRQLVEGKSLVPLVERWIKDHRPWAQEQFLKLLDGPLDQPADRLIVKRLFKAAEGRQDHEIVGACMACFDRLVRRQARVPRARRVDSRFSCHTIYYLRRRAWRYFRRLGLQRPNEYPAAVVHALARYRDLDLPDGMAVLDSWGLVHACFGESDALAFNSSHARLVRPAQLAEMVAPAFGESWRSPAAARPLFGLVASARARVVRVWAAQLLQRDHRDHLADVPLEELLKLLDHADPAIQQLGAQLLENAAGLDRLDVATWLRLLGSSNVNAVTILAELAQRNLRPERLSLGETIELARARPVPVARLGLAFLRTRRIESREEREQLAALANARCEGAGAELAAFALSIVGAREQYDVDLVSRFFDSLIASIRQGAWDWLINENSAGWNDPALWGRLLESPYDDVRFRLVEQLQRRAKLPGVTAASGLAQVWCAVLLGVHRGGRAKLTALRQISDALRENPDDAAALLPVVAIAIRSVRGQEARHGLAAIVAVVEARPQLEGLVRQHLPELVLEPVAAGGTVR